MRPTPQPYNDTMGPAYPKKDRRRGKPMQTVQDVDVLGPRVMPPQPVDYHTPHAPNPAPVHVRVVRRVRRTCGFIALALFVVAGLNSSDRNPLQLPTVFVFMAGLFVYSFTVLVDWIVQACTAFKARTPR